MGYEDNYKAYLDYYNKKIKEKYPNSTNEEIGELITNLEKVYSSLPILHSTTINRIDLILNEGLKSYDSRSDEYKKESLYQCHKKVSTMRQQLTTKCQTQYN